MNQKYAYGLVILIWFIATLLRWLELINNILFLSLTLIPISIALIVSPPRIDEWWGKGSIGHKLESKTKFSGNYLRFLFYKPIARACGSFFLFAMILMIIGSFIGRRAILIDLFAIGTLIWIIAMIVIIWRIITVPPK